MKRKLCLISFIVAIVFLFGACGETESESEKRKRELKEQEEILSRAAAQAESELEELESLWDEYQKASSKLH